MNENNGHYAGCTINPCVCERIEDTIIADESRLTPAELIRKAKAAGLISSAVPDYQST